MYIYIHIYSRWQWRPQRHPGSPAKQAKPSDSKFPWKISDFIHGATLSPSLSPSLSKSLELLKLYAIDPKGTKQSLINSPSCPEFPDSEWTNVLAEHTINLDVVPTGYYSTSNNNEQIEEIGDFKIHFGIVNPTKTASTAGEWSITWNQSSQAICAAFPHRAGELVQYAEYIIGLFAATDVHFHDHVILFDKVVRNLLCAEWGTCDTQDGLMHEHQNTHIYTHIYTGWGLSEHCWLAWHSASVRCPWWFSIMVRKQLNTSSTVAKVDLSSGTASIILQSAIPLEIQDER